MWRGGYPLRACVAGDLRGHALRSCAQGSCGGSGQGSSVRCEGARACGDEGRDAKGRERGRNDDSGGNDGEGGDGCARAKDGNVLRGKLNREGGQARDITFGLGGSIEKWGGSPLVLCISCLKKF